MALHLGEIEIGAGTMLDQGVDIMEKVEEGVLSIDAAENVLSDILQYPQAGQERT